MLKLKKESIDTFAQNIESNMSFTGIGHDFMLQSDINSFSIDRLEQPGQNNFTPENNQLLEACLRSCIEKMGESNVDFANPQTFRIDMNSEDKVNASILLQITPKDGTNGQFADRFMKSTVKIGAKIDMEKMPLSEVFSFKVIIIDNKNKKIITPDPNFDKKQFLQSIKGVKIINFELKLDKTTLSALLPNIMRILGANGVNFDGKNSLFLFFGIILFNLLKPNIVSTSGQDTNDSFDDINTKNPDPELKKNNNEKEVSSDSIIDIFDINLAQKNTNSLKNEEESDEKSTEVASLGAENSESAYNHISIGVKSQVFKSDQIEENLKSPIAIIAIKTDHHNIQKSFDSISNESIIISNDNEGFVIKNDNVISSDNEIDANDGGGGDDHNDYDDSNSSTDESAQSDSPFNPGNCPIPDINPSRGKSVKSNKNAIQNNVDPLKSKKYSLSVIKEATVEEEDEQEGGPAGLQNEINPEKNSKNQEPGFVEEEGKRSSGSQNTITPTANQEGNKNDESGEMTSTNYIYEQTPEKDSYYGNRSTDMPSEPNTARKKSEEKPLNLHNMNDASNIGKQASHTKSIQSDSDHHTFHMENFVTPDKNKDVISTKSIQSSKEILILKKTRSKSVDLGSKKHFDDLEKSGLYKSEFRDLNQKKPDTIAPIAKEEMLKLSLDFGHYSGFFQASALNTDILNTDNQDKDLIEGIGENPRQVQIVPAGKNPEKGPANDILGSGIPNPYLEAVAKKPTIDESPIKPDAENPITQNDNQKVEETADIKITKPIEPKYDLNGDDIEIEPIAIKPDAPQQIPIVLEKSDASNLMHLLQTLSPINLNSDENTKATSIVLPKLGETKSSANAKHTAEEKRTAEKVDNPNQFDDKQPVAPAQIEDPIEPVASISITPAFLEKTENYIKNEHYVTKEYLADLYNTKEDLDEAEYFRVNISADQDSMGNEEEMPLNFRKQSKSTKTIIKSTKKPKGESEVDLLAKPIVDAEQEVDKNSSAVILYEKKPAITILDILNDGQTAPLNPIVNPMVNLFPMANPFKDIFSNFKEDSIFNLNTKLDVKYMPYTEKEPFTTFKTIETLKLAETAVVPYIDKNIVVPYDYNIAETAVVPYGNLVPKFDGLVSFDSLLNADNQLTIFIEDPDTDDIFAIALKLNNEDETKIFVNVYQVHKQGQDFIFNALPFDIQKWKYILSLVVSNTTDPFAYPQKTMFEITNNENALVKPVFELFAPKSSDKIKLLVEMFTINKVAGDFTVIPPFDIQKLINVMPEQQLLDIKNKISSLFEIQKQQQQPFALPEKAMFEITYEDPKLSAITYEDPKLSTTVDLDKLPQQQLSGQQISSIIEQKAVMPEIKQGPITLIPAPVSLEKTEETIEQKAVMPEINKQGPITLIPAPVSLEKTEEAADIKITKPISIIEPAFKVSPITLIPVEPELQNKTEEAADIKITKPISIEPAFENKTATLIQPALNDDSEDDDLSSDTQGSQDQSKEDQYLNEKQDFDGANFNTPVKTPPFSIADILNEVQKQSFIKKLFDKTIYGTLHTASPPPLASTELSSLKNLIQKSGSAKIKEALFSPNKYHYTPEKKEEPNNPDVSIFKPVKKEAIKDGKFKEIGSKIDSYNHEYQPSESSLIIPVYEKLIHNHANRKSISNLSNQQVEIAKKNKEKIKTSNNQKNIAKRTKKASEITKAIPINVLKKKIEPAKQDEKPATSGANLQPVKKPATSGRDPTLKIANLKQPEATKFTTIIEKKLAPEYDQKEKFITPVKEPVNLAEISNFFSFIHSYDMEGDENIKFLKKKIAGDSDENHDLGIAGTHYSNRNTSSLLSKWLQKKLLSAQVKEVTDKHGFVFDEKAIETIVSIFQLNKQFLTSGDLSHGKKSYTPAKVNKQTIEDTIRNTTKKEESKQEKFGQISKFTDTETFGIKKNIDFNSIALTKNDANKILESDRDDFNIDDDYLLAIKLDTTGEETQIGGGYQNPVENYKEENTEFTGDMTTYKH